ncbi:VOC family protein [Paenibacillus sp. CGMCC 1.16610]|uniref:Glyoxalase/bleomycin resistance/dioxygenase family protein n=1 Tax=Paenibacillus anseongense TaxID=2682845 RepID=A0ABW9U2A3_9BACL|nr:MULTISPECIES: VOC family protein [Paenibacillus]MBA2941668.1 VOC family protein [Paenibacillus sp. CGMCC 1.16610]MVQ34187.1 glyoxalase/bleomycin resistance/dioxygenase family protein [Paenibacillus anseongense]
MITHFARVELNTVSIQGVKQFYGNQLQFPISFEAVDEIHLQPSEHCKLVFKEGGQPLCPAHMAFEVPFTAFDDIVNLLQKAGVTLLQWSDGRSVDEFETGKNVYFRDGDGNLLEILAHTYVQEGVLPPSGYLKILFLREIGFPVDNVFAIRELFVELFDFKLDNVEDNFTFAIGGTAHVVVVSKKRKWLPIAMTALQPAMKVTFGAPNVQVLNRISNNLEGKNIPYTLEKDRLHFQIGDYNLHIQVTAFPENIPALLQLP